MFDFFLTPAAFLHALALIGLWAFICRRWNVPLRDWPFFTLLSLWASLVLAGLLAGSFGQLGNLSVYAVASFVSVFALYYFFGVIQRIPAASPLLAPPQITFEALDDPRVRRFLFIFLSVTLGVFALVSAVLAMSVYPDNADSMIYRLPRAFWYVSGGSFMHPFEAVDKRLVFYPIDGVALYIPFVLYGLPGTFHSVPSLFSWGVVVYASYRFARALGADRLIGLFCAWLVGMTPGVLAQAISTNDEILAAGAMLCGFYLFWRWLVSGRHLYFLYAGLAVGLSAGTKLHIVFLMPMLGLIALLAVSYLLKNPSALRRWASALGGRTALITLLAVSIAFLPFLFYNYASTGRFYFLDDFKGDVFNLAASLRGGGQNLLIYISQMILSPIADLNFWPDANVRQTFNNGLNQIFGPAILSVLKQDPAYYHLSYRFVGITLPVSVRFVEFSLWAAFVWILWPWQSLLALRQKQFPLHRVFFIMALIPPLWLLLWSFSTLYMEGTATYFTFYLICAAPAGAFAFARVRWDGFRWACVTFVILTNLFIAHNLVMYSGFRALPDLFYARSWPYDWLLTEKNIIDEIRAADKIRILFTHEKQPYFGYMHWNPRARYYTPFAQPGIDALPEFKDILHIIPVSSLHMYGFAPLKIPHKETKGLTYLGVLRGIGREAIFAFGAGVEKRYPDQSDYIVLASSYGRERGGSYTISFGDDPAGLSSGDHLTFEYTLTRDGKPVMHRPASSNPSFFARTNVNPHEDRLILTIVVRDARTGKEATKAVYPIGGRGAWLSEGGEY